VVAVSSAVEERAARRVGTILRGKYRIVEVLGAGGMATVYAAVHRNGSRVAIKVLHEDLALRSDTRQRFLREGYVANRVGHPGAVRVLDDDVAEDGAAFLVMELLHGETLRARAQRAGGRLPCREVLALGRQLLDVLAAAHGRGVIHRDIKPDNLFLTTERVLKVLDFGIARVEDELGAHATATGTRLGTPAYMPPELALGRTSDVDARTDVWSVGATMFTLISGQLVHEGETGAEIAVRAATTPPRSLASVAAETPPAVVALVDRALGFRREDRWPSAAAMIAALDEAAGEVLAADAIGAVVDAVGETAGHVSGPRTARAAATTLPEMSEEGADALPPRQAETTSAERSEIDIATAPTQPSDADFAATPTMCSDAGAEAIPVQQRAARSEAPPGDTSRPSTVSQAPSALREEPAPARRRGLARWGIVAAAMVAAGVTTAAAIGKRPPPPIPAAAQAKPAGCTSSAECVARSGGAAAICRKEDGACVALATDACSVLAEPGDVGNDATVWIGALWPYRMPDPEHYGRRSANAIDLARRDFAEASGGLPPARPGGPRRPIGVVLCDDHESPERAAAHLVDDLRVPAVLGFATSKEVLDLATSTFIPKGVMAVVATGAATTIRDLPRRPGEPRLVWRVTIATDAMTWPFAAIVEHVIEPEMRASLRPGEPMRVALLRHDSLVGQTSADSRVRALRFNGKSVAENGDAFLQVTRADYIAGGDFTAANEQTARAIAAFRPHVVVDMPPYPALLEAVERAWPKDAPIRPRYLTEGTWNDGGEGTVDWKKNGLAARMYPVDFVAGPATLGFALRYNERFTPRITPATALSTPYDAFYLVAYAAAAAGDQPLTGRSIAAAVPRLLPPGEPIDVGPTGIYPALLALSAGRRIDLQGTATPLDLDLENGETSGNFALYCLVPPKGDAPLRHVESGVTFLGARREMRGARRCP
jgi:serine/threonine-protein kinase